MNAFFQSVTPALRGHLVAHMSFFDDVSRSMFRSGEKLTGLNMLAVRAVMVEAATINAHHWPSSGADLSGMSEAAARAGIDGLRTYHQRMSRITVESQNDLARIILAHSIFTCRTAGSFSEELARNVTEDVAEA